MREYLKLVALFLAPMLILLAVILLREDRVDKASEPPIVTAPCVPPLALPRPALPDILPPNATFISTGPPPERFRGDVTVRVRFESPDEVDRICSGGLPICGLKILACYKPSTGLIMPNPHEYPEDAKLSWQSLFAHELGHVNGWPAWHGD